MEQLARQVCLPNESLCLLQHIGAYFISLPLVIHNNEFFYIYIYFFFVVESSFAAFSAPLCQSFEFPYCHKTTEHWNIS